jgi:3-isopropylmalate/(R)-2-methylmalate dehydratase small subunit
MKSEIYGKALVVGDNIDTDLICPGRFLELTDPVEIGRHCFEGLDKNIAADFPPGGIVVAGKNFGCGSSREHAAIALVNMGVSAVLADSFARIFFRNGINLGLPLIVCKGIRKMVKNGETLLINIPEGTVKVEETGIIMQTEILGEKAVQILSAGGIKEMMRQCHAQSQG